MDNTTTISAIIEAAAKEPPELQPRWIAEQTIAAVRLADAAISDQALEDEFRAWWSAQGWHADLAAPHVVLTHIAWARHLLSGARHASPPSVNPGPCPEFQRPTMDEVMNLANMFGLKVNDCYALMWLVVTSIAAWGDSKPSDEGHG